MMIRETHIKVQSGVQYRDKKSKNFSTFPVRPHAGEKEGERYV